MASVFETISTFVSGLFGGKKQLGSLTVDQILDLMSIYNDYLTDFTTFFENTPPDVLNQLRKKYQAKPRRSDKYPIQKIILDLAKDTKGRANQFERAALFGSIKRTILIYKKLVTDIDKNYKSVIKNNYLILEQARLTDVMFFGLVFELQLVVNYFGYLLEYFLIVLDEKRQPAGYRQKYLVDNYNTFIEIINNTCNSDNFSFLKDVERLQRSGADLLLQSNNGGTFLPFLDRKKYTFQDEKRLTHGVWGFNIIGGIASLFDLWKHNSIQKAKRHKEWVEHEQARLLQIFQDLDPNSPEAQEQQKYIDAYSQEIADLDEKITKYESGE